MQMNPSRRRWLHPGASRLALSAGSLLSCGWWLDSPVASARATNTRVIRVDPLGDITTPSQAARRASDGDTVEIEPGIYRADVAVWPQAAQRIRARVPGTVRLVADGAAAEQKGIWVLHDGNFHVEGVAFEGARVSHANGAGIRFERGSLRLSRCRFADNEMGILTSNDPKGTLVVERCEFQGRRQGAQFGHNVYLGRIASFKVSGSSFHTAFRGHLLKSRARVSQILDCRLIDGPHGQASYELEFPDPARFPRTSDCAVRLAGSIGGNPAAERLGIPQSTMAHWVRRSKAGTLSLADASPVKLGCFRFRRQPC